MNIDYFIKQLDLVKYSKDVTFYADGAVFGIMPAMDMRGYRINFKEQISIIREISKLPEYVYFEGGTFQILIFPNGKDECGFCYQCLGFEEGSKHKEQWDEYHCWDNPLLGGGTYEDENGVEQISKHHTCSFLYLRECIETDEELVGVLKDALEFLTVNKLI